MTILLTPALGDSLVRRDIIARIARSAGDSVRDISPLAQPARLASGDVTIDTFYGTTVTLPNLVAGVFHHVAARRIRATGIRAGY